MKLNIYRDEIFPVYYLYEDNSAMSSLDRKVEIPDELYKEVNETFEQFRIMQEHLEEYYNKADKLQRNTSWSTTSSPSATPTSSTPTS